MLEERASCRNLLDDLLGDQVPQVSYRLTTAWALVYSNFAVLADDVAVGTLENRTPVWHCETNRTFEGVFDLTEV